MIITERFHRVFRVRVKRLQRFTNRFWFPPLLSLLALLDALIIVIPTDGILISSSMLIKKRWFPFALSVAIGSTLGAIALVFLIEHYGLQKFLEFFPGLNDTMIWNWTLNFFKEYGLIVVFLVGVTPLSQQPALIFAALSDHSIISLVPIIFISRLIKFCIMAYIASHAPRLLGKLWGLKDEIKDAGVELK